jgi:glycosyltransferase involved in cell wall biosynthesis
VSASVIICTHNPRIDYFERCLSGLKAQILAPKVWELIVVDNASQPDQAPHPDLSWHPRGRIVFEKQLGLTPARLRGISEAREELLVFVDDDNVLDPDFLSAAIGIAKEKPFLGAWSGQCRPDFETAPPEWTRRYWGNLVVREFQTEVWSNLPRLAASMPSGAGMCVRREVAQHYVDLHRSGRRTWHLDRKGRSLVSGGDNDLAACACDIGLGMGLMPTLRLTHLIPSERLTLNYLVRLAEGIYFSSTLLDAERGLTVTPRSVLGRVVDALQVLCRPGRHGRILRAAYRGRNRAAQLLCSKTEVRAS